MSGSEKTVVQTIIKRKIRNPEEPQENGGWKVAYADFVTAIWHFLWSCGCCHRQTKISGGGSRDISARLQTKSSRNRKPVHGGKGILHGGDTLEKA